MSPAGKAATRAPSRPDTAADLVAAGIDLFGRRGFDAVSTRELAAAARANVAAIAYHFGSKDGLRIACAEAIAARVAAVVRPVSDMPAPDDAAQAEAALAALMAAMVDFLVASPEAEPIARFILREMAEPSEAFERIYAAFMAPTHARICALWAVATGDDPDSAATRLATLGLIGQVVYFRVARPAAMRRLGWTEIGPQEASQIKESIGAALHARVAAARSGRRTSS